MFQKLIVIIIALGLIWSSIIYAPKINAAAVVHDPLNAIINGVTAGTATSLTVKEYVLDPIARAIARTLFNVAVSGIINKIQTGGRDGGAAFVQNWSNFQTNAQYRGENVFRSMLASATLCDYTSGSIKSLFGANTKVPSQGQNLRTGNFDSFALRSNCTMPSNFNMTNYQNDFSGNGGWNAWSRMLEPQNNYYGLLFGSLDESSKQRSLAQSSDIYEATAGGGYTSIRDTCKGMGSNSQCVFMGQIFTPGDLLGKSAASTIDSDLGWLTSSDEISEVIVAIGTALVNRLANLATSKTSEDYKNAPKADTSNSDGYLACLQSCPKADNLTCQNDCAKAWGYPVPEPVSNIPTPPTNGGGLTCSDVPTAQACSVSNQTALVQRVVDFVSAQGIYTFVPNTTDWCGKLEITKRVAWATGAGLLVSYHSSSCNGYDGRIIAYPDNSEIKILNDAGPMWSPGPPGTEYPQVRYEAVNNPGDPPGSY